MEVLLTTLFTAAAACAILYFIALDSSGAFAPLRYFTLVPVTLAAYRRRGLLPGQAMAAFFSSIFLWQLAWGWRDQGLTLATIELAVAVIFLHLAAYAVAGAGASIRGRETLADAARGWEGLLTRIASLDQAVEFIREEARDLTDAREADLLVRNPVDAGWELETGTERLRLPTHPEADDRLTLAQWIATQGVPQLINDLDADPRFEPRALDPTAGPRSLLAQPLVAGDGTLLAILVLLDRRGRPFGRRDGDRLAGLLAAGARALEQAGLLARTDRALARRAAQLAAIQRTARDLNSTLDPARIVRLALDCALEITGADAGLAAAEIVPQPATWQARGGTLDEVSVQALVRAAAAIQRPALDSGPDLPVASVLPGARARLVAPIRRRERAFGVIVTESRRVGAFDGQDLLALAALADHTATALDNTRLFAEIAHERGRLDRIIRTMADGLLSLDAQKRVLSINPAAEALTGWSAQQAVGQPACDLLGCRQDEACQDDCPLARALTAGQVVRQDRFLAYTATGATRVWSLSAAAGSEAAGEGLVVLLQDVTARDEMERFQRELVGSISHEIRAPLANINAVVDLLLADEARSGEAWESLETIRGQSRRLAGFAERMLDVSRLEGGTWQLEARPLPVAILAEEALRAWRAAQPSRPFRLDLPSTPAWAWADEQAAAIVLDSLIENAVKYSPPGTEIVVSVAAGPGGGAAISVTDQGPGIPPEQQARIFERFYRGDGSDAQRVYGHGLGLYVARGLVAAMNGRLEVTSAPGRGSRFTFTLPAPDAVGESTNLGHG
jgi:PAS domain S-box-containing protein